MYVEIKENKLLSWCENPYKDYEYVEIDYSTFDPEKYMVNEGVLVDISGTQEYQDKIVQREKEGLVADLKLQLEALDKKRMRAMAEPELKDTESGETWLEYYNQQAKNIRGQIASI